jgi:hypothetical protein
MDNTCEIDGITYITADEPKGGGCKGCAGEKDSVLCNNFLDELGCYTHKIIWLKKEGSTVKATEVVTFDTGSPSEEITFTESQIAYLSEVFGIDATEEVLKVSDGFVKKSSKVWWKYQFGPEHVKASEHWDNIKAYPDVYSVKEPKYKVVYE